MMVFGLVSSDSFAIGAGSQAARSPDAAVVVMPPTPPPVAPPASCDRICMAKIGCILTGVIPFFAFIWSVINLCKPVCENVTCPPGDSSAQCCWAINKYGQQVCLDPINVSALAITPDTCRSDSPRCPGGLWTCSSGGIASVQQVSKMYGGGDMFAPYLLLAIFGGMAAVAYIGAAVVFYVGYSP